MGGNNDVIKTKSPLLLPPLATPHPSSSIPALPDARHPPLQPLALAALVLELLYARHLVRVRVRVRVRARARGWDRGRARGRVRVRVRVRVRGLG